MNRTSITCKRILKKRQYKEEQKFKEMIAENFLYLVKKRSTYSPKKLANCQQGKHKENYTSADCNQTAKN